MSRRSGPTRIVSSPSPGRTGSPGSPSGSPSRAANRAARFKSRSMVVNSSACFHHETETVIPKQLIKLARKSGQLNLSNRGMIEVPSVVWHIHDYTPEERKTLSVSLDDTDGDQWWDQVDLVKLNLSSNRLTSISPEISNLRSLTSLDLHDNQLDSLPDEIQELRSLTKLSLSHNCFKYVPEGVFQLKELRSLYLQNNTLVELHDDIGNLSLLESLDLSNNKLVTVPCTLGFLSRVTTLNLSNNCITSLPPDIGSMRGLRSLDLTHNELKNIPEQIGDLCHLEQLYIQHNWIQSLPAFHNCANLKEIHAGNNSITEISNEFIESVPSLYVLDLKDNKISVIPEEITKLHHLQRLDLTNNDLSNLPYKLGMMSHLTFLGIEGNSMKAIRRDIIQRGTVQLLRWLRSRMEENGSPLLQHSSRVLGGSHANDVHPDKYVLQNTKALDYSNKGITMIPVEVLNMAAEAEVTVLDLSKNGLTEVPDNLDVLTSRLAEIRLGFNKLSLLPSCFGDCTHLMYLDLRNNQLTDLPPEMEKLEFLREINLSFNRLKHLPDVLFSLSRLEIIFANDNRIEEIDVAKLSKLPMIATLDLRNNDIKQIPPELGNITQLRSLQLEGNPFRNPRPAILAKGTPALLEYLRGRIPR